MQSDFEENRKISVSEFVEKCLPKLGLEVLSGEEFLQNVEIRSERVQKLGLALAGFSNYLRKERIQIIGQSEISYLSQFDESKKIQAINNLRFEKIGCILVTKNLKLPKELLEIAKERQLPVLRTALTTSIAIATVTGFLQKILAPKMTLHGVMLGMYGLGILILGESGIGKSECALDLINKGHRLISDDAVTIKKIGNALEATSPEITREHLEIRGLGIINIRDLFGVTSVGRNKQIDLCIKLKRWDEVTNIDRLGLKMQEEDIFGVKIPKYVLPVSSGRNITTLVETAVRVYLLRIAGHDAAQKLIEKHTIAVSGKN